MALPLGPTEGWGMDAERLVWAAATVVDMVASWAGDDEAAVALLSRTRSSVVGWELCMSFPARQRPRLLVPAAAAMAGSAGSCVSSSSPPRPWRASPPRRRPWRLSRPPGAAGRAGGVPGGRPGCGRTSRILFPSVCSLRLQDGVHGKTDGSREKWYITVTLDLSVLCISSSTFDGIYLHIGSFDGKDPIFPSFFDL